MTKEKSKQTLERRLEHLIAREAIRHDMGGKTDFDKQEIAALKTAIQTLEYALAHAKHFQVWATINPKLNYAVANKETQHGKDTQRPGKGQGPQSAKNSQSR